MERAMRKIATPESIEKARGELISEHKEVTVEGIRQRIGGGSYNTILKHLRGSAEKAAAEEVNAKDPDEEAILADSGMKYIRELYRLCKDRADRIALSGYRSMQGINSEIEEKASQLDELEEKYSSRAQAAEAENAVVKEKLASALNENQLLRDQLKEARGTIKEARDTIEALKRENAEYRKSQQAILQSYNVISEKLGKKGEGGK